MRKDKGIWGLVKKTVDITRKNSIDLAKLIALDALFLFVFGFVVSAFGQKVVDILFASGTLAVRQIEEIQAADSLFQFISQDPALGPLMLKLILVVSLMMFAVYAVYCSIHGMIWAIVLSWTKKINKRIYLMKFAKINLFWGLFALIYVVITFINTLRTKIAQRLSPEVLPDDASMVMLVIVSVLCFVAVVSYAVLGEKKTMAALKLSIKKLIRQPMLWSIPVLTLIAFFLIDSFARLMDQVSVVAADVFGVILLLVTLTLIRVYTIQVVRSYV